MNKPDKKIYGFIGNWGMKPDPDGFGITACRYDAGSGDLHPVDRAVSNVHVGNVSLYEKTMTLYCVDEQMKHPDFGNLGGGGAVYALAIGSDGQLTERNHAYSFAPLPSYTCTDSGGQYLLLTNHSGGDPVTTAEKDENGEYYPVLHFSDASLVLYSLAADGSIDRAVDIYKVTGHGTLPEQPMPHLHSVTRSVEKDLFFVCDKGCNKVYSFRIENERLVKCGEYEDKPGSAPRYSVVLDEQRILFFNHEKNAEITALRFSEDGSLEYLGSAFVLPDIVYESKKESSDLIISSDGKNIYNITRGANIVTVLSVHNKEPFLTVEQTRYFEATTFCGGGARGCTISPDGKYFYICVTDDGDIHRFDLGTDGKLGKEDTILHLGNPANLTFIEMDHERREAVVK